MSRPGSEGPSTFSIGRTIARIMWSVSSDLKSFVGRREMPGEKQNGRLPREPLAGIALAAVAIGCFEVLAHWLLGRNPASLPFQLYFLHEPPSGHTIFQGVLDQVLPATILGCLLGWEGFCKWSPRRLAASVLCLALYLNALESIYRLVIGPRTYDINFGTATTSVIGISIYPSELVVILPVLGVFTYGAYVFRRDWKRRSRQLPTD